MLTAQSREILEVDRLAAEAVSAFGKIDVWLNDAAVLIFGDSLKSDRRFPQDTGNKPFRIYLWRTGGCPSVL